MPDTARQDANATFTVTVTGVDDPPVVAHAIPDLNATEDDDDLSFNLTNVFNDIDDDNASITMMAFSSDESLVTAIMEANSTTLTLDYQPDQFGTATITVTASRGRSSASMAPAAPPRMLPAS